MRIELVKPSVEMEKLISELVFEFKEHNEDTINGCCGLTRCNDYNEWMHYIKQVEEGLRQDRISSSVFVAIDKMSKSIIGIVDIRHYLDEIHFYSGHIGYSIRPSFRCKGYGTEILQLAIEKAKELDIEKLLLSCKKIILLHKSN